MQDGIKQPKLLQTRESQQVQMIGHPDLTVVEDPKHEDSPIATFNLLIAKMGRIHFFKKNYRMKTPVDHLFARTSVT